MGLLTNGPFRDVLFRSRERERERERETQHAKNGNERKFLLKSEHSAGVAYTGPLNQKLKMKYGSGRIPWLGC